MESYREIAERLFAEINAVSLPGPGITRPTYGGPETKAHKVVERAAGFWAWGFERWTDFAGNLHVRLPGPPGVPDVMFGSHLDTVPSGGRYDGTAGVVAGLLLLVRAAREKAVLPASLHLVVLRGEESAWFGKCYLGSSALFGKLPPEHLARKDRDGKRTLGEAIAACGGDPARIAKGEPILSPSRVGRFYELHIEQGPVLDEAGEPMAVVTGIRGNYRHAACTVTGEAGHSGTTPRLLRRDALLAAAELVNRIERDWIDYESSNVLNDLVFTCGLLSTDPATHAVSVVPGKTTFSLEHRSHSSATLAAFDATIGLRAIEVAKRRDIAIDLGERIVTDPVMLDQGVAGAIADLAPGTRRMPSGAGHDAAVFQAAGIPSGMIFVRNRHGSHNPDESMEMDDFLATDLLYRAVTAP